MRYIRSWQMQPLAIAVLAGHTPRDWEISFFDDRMERIDYDRRADLVGISIEAYTARRGYQIAARFRSRGVPVVFGGYHATLRPEEALRHGDAVCAGDAEGAWPRILEDARRGRLGGIYRGEGRGELRGVVADRGLFRGKGYFPVALVETGRGCPYACEFCSVSAFNGATYRRRPTAEVIAELERLGERRVFFVDDNLVGERDSAAELFRALGPMGIRWVSQASIDVCRDPELLALMVKGGCAGLLVGFESLDPRNLAEMGKRVNRAPEYAAALATLRRAGIPVYGTFVFGYANDTPELIERTARFAIEQKLLLAGFNHITPFPGTRLWARVEAEGRQRHGDWWLSDGYRYGQVPFHPDSPSLDAAGVEEHCDRARRRFFGASAILRRAADLDANCRTPARAATFFAVNWLLRGEVSRKRGMPLGARGEGDGEPAP
jgi:radical SAM superfamily enzyme YgiQ (UPF0313 family)